MATLRSLLFGLLLLILLRPTLDLKLESETPRSLVGLIDTSASFSIRDNGTNTRLEQATSALEKLELDLRLYRFDNEPHQIDSLQNLSPTGQQTALGDSLIKALTLNRSPALAGIILTTDGVNTTGQSPIEAADALREAGVPLYIFGVGATSTPDLAIESIDVANTILIGDSAPAIARIRARGMKNQTAKLTLKLDTNTVAEKEITIDADGTIEVP